MATFSHKGRSERSPDEAKRNPGCVSVCGVPDFASLHPGYDNSIIRFRG
jgi:hypothetical protein